MFIDILNTSYDFAFINYKAYICLKLTLFK